MGLIQLSRSSLHLYVYNILHWNHFSKRSYWSRCRRSRSGLSRRTGLCRCGDFASGISQSGYKWFKKAKSQRKRSSTLHYWKKAIHWAVAACDPLEIDRLNILWASVRAMHLALDQIPLEPDMILVDGNRFKPYRSVAHTCVIEGMPSISLSQLLLSWPRRIVTNTCKPCTNLFHSMDGIQTKVIQLLTIKST